MNWEQLLSLKRHGDSNKRLRNEQDETRLGFDVDYDRIIFSPEFRSLQDKTQVVPLSSTDFVHTRLTHSLEVSVVARSLGRRVGVKVLEKHPYLKEIHGYKANDFGAIVAAAALAHDIGNPPFGHSGEKAIGHFFKSGVGQRFKDQMSPKEYQDLCDFEGNANGFKVLTQDKQGSKGGLRLSYATLGTFTKYPKESLPVKPNSNIASKKYGFFQTEKSSFLDVASELGMKKLNDQNIQFSRHPLAFLVEAADDICYTIIDFEDGINLGLIEEEFALEYLIALVKHTIDTTKYHKLSDSKDRLTYLRSMAIGVLIQEAAQLFLANEEAILAGTFSGSLLDNSKYKAQINDIIKISVTNVYQSQEVIEKEIAGYKILSELLDTFTTAVENYHTSGELRHYDALILTHFDASIKQPQSVYQYVMACCSLVSRLTDGNALQIFQKINGKI